MASGRLFCFGLGFVGERFARRLRAEGWAAGGTTRDPARVAALAAEGIAAVPFDGDRPVPDEALAGTTHLLAAIPPGEGGDPALNAHADALRRMPTLRWVGYLSTPAVYGDRGGAWVSEDDAPLPGSERGRRRLAAEAAWRAALPVQVFRLAGIYGPGRSAFDQLRSGRARRIDKPGQVFNRIHVDDIGGVLLASFARPRDGGIYNVADALPSSPNDPIDYAARLMGVEPPPLVPFDRAALSPMARSFYEECKRLDTTRLRAELGVRLAYPTFREGLDAIWRGEAQGTS